MDFANILINMRLSLYKIHFYGLLILLNQTQKPREDDHHHHYHGNHHGERRNQHCMECLLRLMLWSIELYFDCFACFTSIKICNFSSTVLERILLIDS